MRLSHSRIQTWKRCWKKYQYKYVDHLEPKKVPRPPRLGRLGHTGIETWLKGEDWKQAVNELWENEIPSMPGGLDEGSKEEDLSLIKGVLERFFDWHDHYRSEDEKNLLEPEYSFEQKLKPTPAWDGDDDILTGRFDQVVRVPNEGIWLIDHKFTTSSPEKKLEKLELNEQIDYYIWALNQMYPDQTIQGAIFTAIALELPTKPEPIKSGERLSRRKVRTDHQTLMKAIEENGFDPEDYQERLQSLKEQKNPFFQRESVIRDEWELENIGQELRQLALEMGKTNQYIRSRSNQCSWDCPYKDPCMTEKKGGDVESVISEQFEDREERKSKKEQEQKKAERPF